MFVFNDSTDDDDGSTSGATGVATQKEVNSFDWKNSGIGNNERLTRKIDVKEANIYDAKKKNDFQGQKNPLKTMPNGLNKLRKKIRDVYDEDEDEDEWGVVVARAPEDPDNSLINALSENEKKALKQQENTKTVQMLQTAGKMEAMSIANQMAKEIGMKGIDKKQLNKNMQNAIFDPEKAQGKIIKDDILKEKGIKGDVKVKDIIQTARGIKRVENVLGSEALKNMESKEVAKLGQEKASQKDMAKLIAEKRGLDKKTAEKLAGKQDKRTEMKYLSDMNSEKQSDKSKTKIRERE